MRCVWVCGGGGGCGRPPGRVGGPPSRRAPRPPTGRARLHLAARRRRPVHPQSAVPSAPPPAGAAHLVRRRHVGEEQAAYPPRPAWVAALSGPQPKGPPAPTYQHTCAFVSAHGNPRRTSSPQRAQRHSTGAACSLCVARGTWNAAYPRKPPQAHGPWPLSTWRTRCRTSGGTGLPPAPWPEKCDDQPAPQHSHCVRSGLVPPGTPSGFLLGP